MADTCVETISPGDITLTFTGAGASWDSQTHFPGGLKVTGIKFYPTALNDTLIIRSKTATGGILCKMKDTLNAGLVDTSFGGGIWMFPYLYITEQTFGTPANAVVMFMLA